MKRDLDLMRDIMLRIEERCPGKRKTTSAAFADLTDDLEKIGFHLYLLYDAGFIDAIPVKCTKLRYTDYFIYGLTFRGCDYLDSVRDASIWSSVKENLLRIGGSATMDVIAELASSLLRDRLGI